MTFNTKSRRIFTSMGVVFIIIIITGALKSEGIGPLFSVLPYLVPIIILLVILNSEKKEYTDKKISQETQDKHKASHLNKIIIYFIFIVLFLALLSPWYIDSNWFEALF